MKWTLEKRIHNVFEYILISKLCFKLKNNDLFYDENRLSKHVEDIFKNNQTIIFNLQDKTSKFFDNSGRIGPIVDPPIISIRVRLMMI